MKAKERSDWMRLIEGGYDPKLALTSLSLPPSLADEAKFQKLISAAQATATARLRQRVLKLAITNEDLRSLERELERRELVADTGGVQRIERLVLSPPGGYCVHCHKPQGTVSARKTNGKATE